MLHIMMPLSAHHGQHTIFLRATIYMVLTLNALKQPQVALTFIETAQQWVEQREQQEQSGAAGKKIGQCLEYIYMMATKAEVELLLNHVRLFVDVLQTIEVGVKYS